MMMLILIVVIVWLYYHKDTAKMTFAGTRSAEEQLKERFVRGEIDEETYLRMKDMIK